MPKGTYATPYTTPSTPHDLSMLLVTYGLQHDDNTLLGAIVRWGYNVTHLYGGTKDYTTDPLSSDLSQYDVVMVNGHTTAFGPTKMTEAEVLHFMNYDGILLWHYAGVRNETSNLWWSSWDASPITNMEARLGLLWSSNPASNPANTTLYLQNSSFVGAPATLTQWSPSSFLSGFYQGASGRPSIDGATEVYNITSPSGAVGISYYKNATGAIGIWFNTLVWHWISGSNPDWTWNKALIIDDDEVAKVLHSLLSYALQVDPYTVIKPQPLATYRVDDFPVYTGTNDSFSRGALNYSQAAAELYEVPVTYALVTGYNSSYPLFWTRYLELDYSEWLEGATHLNHAAFQEYTQAQCEALHVAERLDFDGIGIERYMTYIVGVGSPPYNTEAMRLAVNNLGILNMDLTSTSGNNVTNGTLLHGTVNIGAVPDFAEDGKEEIYFDYQYVSERPQLRWLAEGSFANEMTHLGAFYLGEVGNEQIKVYSTNMTSRVPTIKFVTLYEAALHYGNKWMQISSATRSSNTVSFTVTAPNTAIGGVGKGMLWIYVGNSTQKIASVTVDGEAWYLYDDYTIRIPATDCDVVVTLGTESATPNIDHSDRQITVTSYSSAKLGFTVKSGVNTRSITKVNATGKGEPSAVYGATSSSYNSTTQIVTITYDHTSTAGQSIEVEFNFSFYVRALDTDTTLAIENASVYWTTALNTSATWTTNSTGWATGTGRGVVTLYVTMTNYTSNSTAININSESLTWSRNLKAGLESPYFDVRVYMATGVAAGTGAALYFIYRRATKSRRKSVS